MRYLLDTNVWIHYLKHSDSPVAAYLKQTPARNVVLCSVVWAELLYGAGRCHGFTVVTNDREFSRVTGLAVADWTVA